MNWFDEYPNIVDYCFNEFLKTAETLQGDMYVDKKVFLRFLLIAFADKVHYAKPEELSPLDPFPLSQKKTD